MLKSFQLNINNLNIFSDSHQARDTDFNFIINAYLFALLFLIPGSHSYSKSIVGLLIILALLIPRLSLKSFFWLALSFSTLGLCITLKDKIKMTEVMTLFTSSAFSLAFSFKDRRDAQQFFFLFSMSIIFYFAFESTLYSVEEMSSSLYLNWLTGEKSLPLHYLFQNKPFPSMTQNKELIESLSLYQNRLINYSLEIVPFYNLKLSQFIIWGYKISLWFIVVSSLFFAKIRKINYSFLYIPFSIFTILGSLNSNLNLAILGIFLIWLNANRPYIKIMCVYFFILISFLIAFT